MASIKPYPVTADTTKISVDSTRNRPVAEMQGYLRTLLPPWFEDADRVLDGMLGGIASLLAYARGLIGYAKLQTRVATSTGGFLDLTAYDFFRNRMRRRLNEADPAYQYRLRREVFRPRATRAAIVQAVTELTGTAPDIFEPWHPGDCGAYGVGNLAYGGSPVLPAFIAGLGAPIGGYGTGAAAYMVPESVISAGGGAGCYGSLELPNQIFVRVHRAANSFGDLAGIGAYGVGNLAYGGGSDGIPAVSGYGGPLGGYGIGGAAYLDPHPPYGSFIGAGSYGTESVERSISNAEIYETIAETTGAGVIAWTTIQGP